MPAALRPCGSAAAAASAAAFLAAPAISTPVDVAGALADQAGAVEDLAELGAQVGVGGAEHQRGRAGDRLAGVGRAAEAGDRAGAHPFADVLGRAAGPAARSGPWSAAAPRSGRRPGRRSPRPPAAATPEGIARQTRSRPASSISEAGARRRSSPAAAPPAGSGGSRPPRSSPPPARRCGRRAGPRGRRGRAARRPRSPSCRRRSRRRGASAAGRRALPTAAATLGQIRAVTVSASAGEGSSARGKVIARPSRTLTLRGRIRQPRRTCSVPSTAAGITGAPVCSASRPTPRLGVAEGAAADPRALGEDADGAAALDDQAGGLHRLLVGLAAADREGAEPGEDPALPAALEQLDLGDVVHRPPPGQAAADREGVEEAAVVGGDDQAALDAGRARGRSARSGSRRGRTAS